MKHALDGMGRTTESILATDPMGPDYTVTAYDLLGRVASVTNPYRSIQDPTYGSTFYTYDVLDRMTGLTNQDDNTTESWTYTGNTTAFTNEIGFVWDRSFDALGRLTQVKEPGPGDTTTPTVETDYQYDALDDLTRVDQWGGPLNSTGDRVRQFVYDGLGRLTSSRNPEVGAIGYLYVDGTASLCSGDEMSPCSRTDARGVMTAYRYDALNRLIGKTYSNDPSNTPAVSLVYDTVRPAWVFPNQMVPALTGIQQTNLIGRLSSESNANQTIVYGYDAMGRTTLKSVCTPSTCGPGDHFDLHYQYDVAGNMKFADLGLDAVRNASAPSAGYYYGGVSLQYDNASQLITGTADIVDATHPASIVSGLQYSPLGGVTSLQFGSVYGEGDQYTPRGWLLTRYGTDVTNGLQRTGTLTHDGVGNVTKLVDSYLGTTMYTYDQLNRLTSFSNPYAGVNYGFDAWGNMTTHIQTVGAGYSFSLNYNTNNQTTQAGSTNGGLTYDAAGDVLSDGLNSYGYDGEGRLLSVDGSTGYLYGSDGMRVATTQGGTVTAEYLYDLNNTLVTTLGTDGKMVRGSLYGGGMHLADYTAGTGAGGGHTEFRFMDEVNSLAIKVDQDGNVLENCYQNPFGESLNCNGSDSNGVATDFTETHFTDKKRDAESGLDYFGARYYGSNVGRFMSPDYSDGADPVPFADLDDPQTLNLYSYVRNNPLSRTDPTGHDACCLVEEAEAAVEDAGVAAGVGGISAAAGGAVIGHFIYTVFNPAVVSTGDLSPAQIQMMSKGGNQNHSDSYFENLSPEELDALLRDPRTSPSDRAKIIKQQKANATRNAQKRGGGKQKNPPVRNDPASIRARQQQANVAPTITPTTSSDNATVTTTQQYNLPQPKKDQQ